MMLTLVLGTTISFSSCGSGDDDDVITPGGSTGNSYGDLNGALVATGSTKDISFQYATLLASVDVQALTSQSQSYQVGVVWMKEKEIKPGDSPYDYETRLVYGRGFNRTTTDIMQNQFQIVASDLCPNAKYYYRAFVKIGENYHYGKICTFNTVDPSKYLKLSTGETSSINAISAVVGGSATFSGTDDLDIRVYVLYSTTLNTAEKLNFDYIHDGAYNYKKDDYDIKYAYPDEQGVIKCSLPVLIPNTKYYYRVCVRFEYGDREDADYYAPEVRSFTTSDVSTIGLQTNAATDITSTSATINGQVEIDKLGIDKLGDFYCDFGFLLSTNISSNTELDHSSSENKYITSYYNYREDDMKDGVVYDVGANIDQQTGKLSFTISGLSKEQKIYYRFYMYIHDTHYGYIRNYYGDVKSFTTKGIEKTEYIDMGNGVKWAACNIDATSPEQLGFCGPVTNAQAKLTTGTRLPTTDDVSYLRKNCTWSSITYKGVAGYLVSASNGNAIFLPGDYNTYYWTSSKSSDSFYYAFRASSGNTTWDYYTYDYYARCVKD